MIRSCGKGLPDHKVGTKVYRHAVVGELTLDWDMLTCTTGPDQQLVVLTAEPGSASYQALVLLASWAATERESAADPTTPAVAKAEPGSAGR